MAIGDTYRKVDPSDLLIFDANNNLIGIKSGTSSASELRSPPGAAGNIAANRNALASDSGSTFGLASGITYTLTDPALIPAGVILQGNAAGGGTIAVSGSATINGATIATILSARQVAVVLPTPGSTTDLTVKVSS